LHAVLDKLFVKHRLEGNERRPNQRTKFLKQPAWPARCAQRRFGDALLLAQFLSVTPRTNNKITFVERGTWQARTPSMESCAVILVFQRFEVHTIEQPGGADFNSSR
jgi:hypothetical protein